jgi:hypothetical protein
VLEDLSDHRLILTDYLLHPRFSEAVKSFIHRLTIVSRVLPYWFIVCKFALDLNISEILLTLR